MKKLLMFIAMAVFCTAGFAKTADEVINEIKAATNAQVISFDKEMLKQQFKGNDDIPKEFLILSTRVWSWYLMACQATR